MVRTTDEQAFAILDDLVMFVHRVATNEKASPEEIKVLPEMVKILLGHTSLYSG